MLCIVIKFLCVLVVICILAVVLNTIDKKRFARIKFNNVKTPLILITLYNDKQPLNFVLDTGSSETIISSQYIHKLKHAKTIGSASVYGLEGNSVQAEIVHTKISFSEKGKEYPISIEIMDFPGLANISNAYGVEVVGVLGNDFCENFKAEINYNKRILKLKV